MTAQAFLPDKASRSASAGKGRRRPWPHQADGLTGLTQGIHGCLRLGGEGAHHHEADLGVVAAIALERPVGPAEALAQGRPRLRVDLGAV